jgi:hypothetical protein
LATLWEKIGRGEFERPREEDTIEFARDMIDAHNQLVSLIMFVLMHESTHAMDECRTGEEAEVNADITGIFAVMTLRLEAGAEKNWDFPAAVQGLGGLTPADMKAIESSKEINPRAVEIIGRLLSTHGNAVLRLVLRMYEVGAVRENAGNAIPLKRRQELLERELRERIRKYQQGEQLRP